MKLHFPKHWIKKFKKDEPESTTPIGTTPEDELQAFINYLDYCEKQELDNPEWNKPWWY